MTQILQDIRFALRGFRKAPGFAAIAIATLAIGIGANTAIFSVVDTVLLRPLRFPAAERLVVLADEDSQGRPDNVGWATYADWRRLNRAFSGIAAMSTWNPTLTGRDQAQPLRGLRVSQEFFRTLGVGPAIGRDFLPEEDQKDRNHEVILAHGLFERSFAGNRSIVGKPISIGGVPYTVVGILPADFESVFAQGRHESTEIWSPLAYDASLPQACRTCRHLRAIGRLKPGVSLAQGRADLDAIQAGLARAYPTEYVTARVSARGLSEQLFGGIRPALLALLGAVALVLAIACANVGSLLLARLGERRSEIAIRYSLGASRGRVMRMLVTESLVLSFLGGGFGLLLASWLSRALVRGAPIDLPRLASVAIDLRVLAVCALVSVLTGLAFGIAPAISIAAARPAALASSSRGSIGKTRRRFLAGLVVADVALAVVLLAGAGLLTKSLSRLFRVDPGFDPRRTTTMQVHLSGKRYREDPPILDFYRRALERVRALPGVESAAVVSQIPLGDNFDSYSVHREDRPSANPETDPSADRYSVSADYLRTMRIPILAGRGITPADGAAALPVVVVNRELARQFGEGAAALGKRVRVGGNDGPWRTIVGIASDVRHRGLDVPLSFQIYLPQEQFSADNDMILVYRNRDGGDVSRAAAAAVRSLDRDQVVDHVAPMEEIMAESASRRRFATAVISAFGAMAVLLAIVGIAGVAGRAVGQRRREFGVRLALGATPSSILRLVAAGSAGWIGLGVAAGLVAALGFTRLLASELFGIGPRDPVTLLTVSAVTAAVALAASLVPARRATRLDPSIVLRES